MNLPELDPDFCIEKQIFRHSRKNSALYLSVIFGVLIALLSMPFVYVDIVVHGVGMVRPIEEKVELKAPVAEKIVQVFVQEGSTLKRGDTVLLLNSASVDASIYKQQSLQSELKSHTSDLQALCKLQKSSYHTEQRHQEYLLFQQQKEELELSIETANKKLKRNEPLFRSGVIPQDEFENYQQEKKRSERILQTFMENRLSEWKTELNELRRQETETKSELKRLEQERTQLAVTAPVAGTLEQFAGLYTGGHVFGGQTLGVISPDSTLVVECYLPPRDIGFIHLSMRVSVMVEAFDYNQWGKLIGQVSDISSDFVLMNEAPYYKVKCRIDKPFLALSDGRKGFLKKGMSVQTRFLVNRRSLFHLIYEKMDDWANPLNR